MLEKQTMETSSEKKLKHVLNKKGKQYQIRLVVKVFHDLDDSIKHYLIFRIFLLFFTCIAFYS